MAKPILFLDDNYRRHFLMMRYLLCDRVFTADEAIVKLSEKSYYAVFLDHDLDGHEYADSDGKNTGMEVVRYIVKEKPSIERIIIHSHNEKAAALMHHRLYLLGYSVITLPFNELHDIAYNGDLDHTIENIRREG